MGRRPKIPRAAWCGVGLLGVVLGPACREPEPAFREAQVLGGKRVEAEVLNRGAEVYRLRCASCHGYAGAGDGPAARGLKHPPTNFSVGRFRHTATGDGLPTDEALGGVIRNGLVEHGMPPWPGLVSEDRDALVQYLKTFSARWKAPEASP